MEIWKKIPGFSRYEASNLGRIRNINNLIIKQRLNGTRKNNKYLVFDAMGDGIAHWRQRRKILLVHRAILMAFCGSPSIEQIACHKNDDKMNNNLANLYWGTAQSNAADSIHNGSFNFPHPGIGENHHSVKFTDELINKIRKEYTGSWGEQTKLAKKYGLSINHVSVILRNKLRKTA
jgi:hypothetical protein